MWENGLEGHARAALRAWHFRRVWRYRLIRVQWDCAELRESAEQFGVAVKFFGPICLRRKSQRFPRILQKMFSIAHWVTPFAADESLHRCHRSTMRVREALYS